MAHTSDVAERFFGRKIKDGVYVNSIDTVESFTNKVCDALLNYISERGISIDLRKRGVLIDQSTTVTMRFRTKGNIFQEHDVIQEYFECVYQGIMEHVAIYNPDKLKHRVYVHFVDIKMKRPIQILDDGVFSIETVVGFLILLNGPVKQ